jgi:CubicO group peptidase (beta-lactamase class C family)
MKYHFYLLLFTLVLLSACNSSDETIFIPLEGTYFPPLTGTTWETTNAATLQWDAQKITELQMFLEVNETRAFIVLVDGKIVLENYWNDDLQGNPFTADSNWYWASAGKSLTATLIGIAQEEGSLNINDKTSDYLGAGWTSMPANKEDLISIKNQLSFTTGIDYNVPEADCTAPACLNYLTDAGDQWYYHNGTYTLLHRVLENAAGVTNNQFTNTAIKDKIGMDGSWLSTNGLNEVYFSTARSAARFGLLTLNEGLWKDTIVLGDATYFNSMTTISQSINESYGYLWWLNGKDSVVFPGTTAAITSSVTPSGPIDMISALGKNGQFIDVVPNLNMVVIRMGDTPAQEPVPVLFHEEMWAKIVDIVN